MVHFEDGSERRHFEAALQLEGGARESYLCGIGAERVELEQRVRALLAAHARPELDLASGSPCPSPTETPPEASSASQGPSSPRSPSEKTPSVGPYRLLERLGEGGMGVVYVAEQTEPVRRLVALKLIKGATYSQELLGRFHAERQTLALMNHPNIARILDAGTTEDGRPYFVMEYVEGVVLLEYCDRRRLAVDARLELFIAVCMAVQHAHQKGVIHRDLKPSNILVEEVDGKAIPKVIDFGVAKTLHPRLSDITLHTRLGGFIGTPEYVSPEQAQGSGLDIDTRADVYSLGTVLYVLLTGLLPFDFRDAGFAEIQQTLAERAPRPPSTRVHEGDAAALFRARSRRVDTDTLFRTLRGDLDWITMKTLEKDRARRYDAASELAADLERYRAHEAVAARPPSTAYRIGRFVRRHNLLLAVGSLALLALVVGTIGTSIGLVRARQEAERAHVSATIAKEINTFLNDDLLASVAPEKQGIDVSMRQVLDTAAQRIDGRFPEQPLVEASLRRTIGRTYSSLGVFDVAEPHLLRSLELFEQTLGSEHDDTRGLYFYLGGLYRAKGRNDEAEGLLNRVLHGVAAAPGVVDPDVVDTLTLAALEELAIVYHQSGRYELAEGLYLRALEAREATSGREHPDTMRVMGNLAIVYRFMERWQVAERMQQEVVAINRSHYGPEHPQTLNALSKLAALYLGWGRNDDAEALLQATLDPMHRVMGAQHPQTLMMANNLGWLYLKEGRYPEAEALLLETYSVKREVLGELHPSTVEGLENLLILYETMGSGAQHQETLGRYAETLHRVCEGPTARTQDRVDYANLLLTAEVETLRDAERALALARQAVDETDRANAEALAVLARAFEQTGDRDRAVATAREAVALTPEGSEVRFQLEDLLVQSV